VAKKPPHVVVLDDLSPREIRPGVEVVGAPWTSKRPLRDLVAAAAAMLQPHPGVVRVMVGHGAVDALSPDPNNPALIGVAAAQASLDAGVYHYLALGDRHSLTRIGGSDRMWYAGTPVATDFDEVHPGCVLVVELDASRVTTTPHEIGSWRFRTETRDVANDADIEAFERLLRDADAKDRTVLRLALSGSLTLRQSQRVTELIDHQRDVYAAITLWERHTKLVVVPEDGDFSELGLTGFAQAAVVKLREAAAGADGTAATARDALALLVRLARSAP
jgi:DNA repair exonuclease SbcCD nuclease subunit